MTTTPTLAGLLAGFPRRRDESCREAIPRAAQLTDDGDFDGLDDLPAVTL